MSRTWVARAVALSIWGCSAGAASAQSFVNGGFETNDLSGWTVGFTPNGATGVQTVEAFDMDGPGPLAVGPAAKFQVGNAVTPNQPVEGIELTQVLALTGGTQYTFDLDWAAIRTIAVGNADGGRFAIIVNGTEIAVASVGSTTATELHSGHLTGQHTPASSGNATVGVRITRSFLVAGSLYQYVDNITIDGGTNCYPDCNGDTALTIADFACFQAAFVAGNPYADCNSDTALTIADFACFQAAFVAGCP